MISFATSTTVPDDADVVVVPVAEGRAGAPAEVDVAFLEQRGFEGKGGEALALPGDGRTVLAVGVGNPKEATLDTLRRTAAAAVRAAWKSRHVAIPVPAKLPAGVDQAAAGRALAEGAGMAAYQYTTYKGSPKPCLVEQVTIVAKKAAAPGVTLGARVAEAVCFARDMINAPPVEMTPSRIARLAEQVAEREGLTAEIWDEERIETERLGGLGGVAAGSEEPARLIKLTYEPKGGATRTVALVGKGITFDSGGLSLKTGEGMMTMKTDMAGAAAVVAAMSAVAAIEPDVRVVAYAACTENMPSGTAIKPGDVLRIRNGKTVEVLNTDAEGRLVLADALSLAVEDRPVAIVDLATLTGACIVALGREITGLMGNDDDLVARVQAAAERAGEDMWHLPLPDRYRKHIDSDIADIKNIGATGQAGTLAAGLFLKEFVADLPWVHLDIAGPSRAEADDGYIAKGGTGVGVRTLLELLASFER